MANNVISTGLNTGNTIFNSNGGTLISGDAVKGGYFVTDAIVNIPSWAKVDGTLCYCTNEAKFYQYKESSQTWTPALEAKPVVAIPTAEIEALWETSSDEPENTPAE